MVISKTKIIAVEGQDEINFFNAILKHLDINDVQVINFEGKSNFDTKIKSIVNIPGFRSVNLFALIRDADKLPPISAFESITSSLTSVGLSIPNRINSFTNTNPSIGIFIMPGNSQTGMLEDLCIASIQPLKVNPCINSYLDCSGGTISNVSKAKVLCYLATKSPLVNSLGLGALKGYWDFNSEVFSEIISFLTNMK